MSAQYKQIKRKIFPLPELLPELKDWKAGGANIVFTNGCFDILHLGHINYLAKASDLGDKLILGVNSDDSVKRLKGPSRPIQDQMARMMILAALSFTDAIVLFDEDTPETLIKQITPNVLVKGGDYKPEHVVGAQHVHEHGGKVEILSFLEGYSTSLIEGKIKADG